MLSVAAAFLVTNRSAAQIAASVHKIFDNVTPVAGLVLSGNTLYGTTSGSAVGSGTIFKVNTDGSSFSNFYNFTPTSTNALGIATNSDGAALLAGLILIGDTLYGTASAGGTAGSGTVFRIDTDGSHFTNLHNFSAYALDSSGFETNDDGAVPQAPLIVLGNVIYGITSRAGHGSTGTVFRLNPDGTGFSNVCALGGDNFFSPLASSGNTLYWTSGPRISAVNIDGTSLTNIYLITNGSDGFYPEAGVTLSGTNLYGTCWGGGAYGYGTVFRVSTNGTGFTNLYQFTGGSDGSNPQSGLLLSGNTLYGASTRGGSGSASVFQLNTDGTGFATIFVSPYADLFSTLLMSSNTLYGTLAGATGDVLAISIGPIPLNVGASGTNIVLTWGNPGFSLQASPIVNGTFTNVMGAASPYTDTLPGSEMFFRLKSN